MISKMSRKCELNAMLSSLGGKGAVGETRQEAFVLFGFAFKFPVPP